MNINKFDIEVSIRNYIYGGIIGWLSSAWLKSAPPEVLTLTGTIVGGFIDYAFFSVKKLLKEKKDEQQ